MQSRKFKYAGSFYPLDKKTLKKEISECFLHQAGPGKIETLGEEEKLTGVIVPHAGYMYSGPVAAFSYNEVAKNKIRNFVLIGPNHTGLGTSFSLWDKGRWETPLGSCVVNENLAAEILKLNFIKSDFNGHLKEHSLEVQIPFLQFLFAENFFMVAISILEQNLSKCEELGKYLAKIYAKEKFIIIASTDFTHYETAPEAKRRDSFALNSILNLDANDLFHQIKKHRISMCGYGPVFTLISFAKELNCDVKLLKYSNSGEVSATSHEEVVAYSSFKFTLS